MLKLPGRLLEALRWWMAVGLVVGLTGSVAALFLEVLDAVTLLRFREPWLLWCLPALGALVAWFYQRFGGSADRGHHLLIEEIHQPGAGVPARMAPLIFLGTLATHLGGGSAGREGTALQLGGGIAAWVARLTRLPAEQVRLLLMAGIAAGFGAVFGTPMAGAVFALEVLVIGRIQNDALVPCVISSLAAFQVSRAWGAVHEHYDVAAAPAPYQQPGWLLAAVMTAVLCGAAASGFARSCRWSGDRLRCWLPNPVLRAAVGGLAVVGLVWLCGNRDYLGLGTLAERPGAVTLGAALAEGEVPASAWWWKWVFTLVTLSAGLRGGEVTPLLFIGAALGNALAGVFGVPSDFLASLAMVAMFSAATNTPIASTLLGIELFGAENSLYLALVCVVAYRCSAHRGIYPGQRLAQRKFR